MPTVTIQKAKTNFSSLVKRVEAGEEIVIARGKTPVAKLVGLGGTAQPVGRVFGAARGLYGEPPDGYFTPLSEDEVETWE